MLEIYYPPSRQTTSLKQEQIEKFYSEEHQDLYIFNLRDLSYLGIMIDMIYLLRI